MAEEGTVRLMSSDGEMFRVHLAVAFQSQIIRNVIEDTGRENVVPLPMVSSRILARVIQYCELAAAMLQEDVEARDQYFVNADPATLYDLRSAAYYLDIRNLLDLCQAVADRINALRPPPINLVYYSSEEEEDPPINLVYHSFEEEEEM